MSNENQPRIERGLAVAATPEDIGNTEPAEVTHDPAGSLRIGLAKLYYNYSREIENQLKSGLIDGNKANELTAQVDELSLADLGNEISKGVPLEIAKEIMGQGMYFGPEEVKQAFGIEITEQIPPIPFSPEELDRAKALGQFLVLRIDQTADGQPLTMEKIEQLVQPKFDSEGKGEVLFHRDSYKTESFFTSQTPTMEWALTTRETIPDSKDKNYLEQTQVLADYLEDQVFKGEKEGMPSDYSDAIAEFNANKDAIKRLMESDWQAFTQTQKLSELKINRLTRQWPVEALYDELIYYQNTNEWILESESTWTNARSSDGRLVIVGDADSDGVSVGMTWPDDSLSFVGVSFSRRGADLKS